MSKQNLLIVFALIFLLPLNSYSWDDDDGFGDESFGGNDWSDEDEGGGGGFEDDFSGSVPKGNAVTGAKILKASQRFGMTDNELKYFLNNIIIYKK